MGQYVVNEKDGKYLFNLAGSNGHILATSMVFPSRDDCLAAIGKVKTSAAGAGIEDTTVDPMIVVPGAKYRIFQTLTGNYFFRFYPAEGEDVVQSHTYPHKDSLLRRIERMRVEGDSSIAEETDY